MSRTPATTTMLERIQSHVEGRGVLSEADNRIYQRLLMAFGLIRQRDTKASVVRHLTKLHDSDGHQLSESQAWRDVRMAERLFGNYRKYEKEVLRILVIEEALKDSKHAQEVATACYRRRDYKAWEAAMKIKNKAEERLINAGGLNKEDMIVPDFDRIQPPNIEISLPEEQIEILRKMAAHGAVNFTKDLETEDAIIVENSAGEKE